MIEEPCEEKELSRIGDQGREGTTENNRTDDSMIDESIFKKVPMNKIVVEAEQRNFNIEHSADKNLVATIVKMGIIEPILCQLVDDGYLLLAGERRYKAAIEANLDAIPICILPDSLSQKDVTHIRIVENMQRENVDPITEAKRYFLYLQQMVGYPDLTSALTGLISYGRRRNKLESSAAEKISALEVLSGKSSRTIQNQLKLLNLPEKIQQEIIGGGINLSQGYLLSKFIDHQRFDEVCQARLTRKMTNEELISSFESVPGNDLRKGNQQFRKHHGNLRKIRIAIEKNRDCYDNSEKKKLRKEIDLLLILLDTMECSGSL